MLLGGGGGSMTLGSIVDAVGDLSSTCRVLLLFGRREYILGRWEAFISKMNILQLWEDD